MNDEQPTHSQEVADQPGNATDTSAAGMSVNGNANGAGAVEDTTSAQMQTGAVEAEASSDLPAAGTGAVDADTVEAATAYAGEADTVETAAAYTGGAGTGVEADAAETADTSGTVGAADAAETADTADAAGTVDVADTATPESADMSGAMDVAAEAIPVAAADAGDVTGAEDTGIAGAAVTAEGEASEASDDLVVRSARDPRLDEVAPNASMEDLLRASEQQYRTLKHGDVIEGTVMKLGRDEILVDIGAKTEGIIPSHELQSLSPEEREAMEIGDEVLVSVVQPENAEGHAILSLDRARQERSWRELQKKFEAGEIIQARVTGYNKGGLLVNLEGVRGFVPSSQISSMPPGDANKQAEMAKMQNQTLPLKIIEINRNRNRLILSERQAMQEQRESMRTRLLRELEPGQVRPGTVSSICDFGAFVDIGGADGLIHLSELSWKRVSHPSEVLRVGDRIDVYVLSVDPNERKIALSLKRTQPEPWSTITENYSLGQIVRGTITQLTTFGAFARLEDGIEGLIHVSELAEGRVAHPKNVVNVGDQLDLKVIRIDPAKRRIGLSLKRVNEDAEGAGGQGGYGQPIVGEGNQATTQGAFGEEGGAGGDYLETAPRSQSADVEAHSEGVRDFVTQPQGQVQGEPSARPQTQDRGQSRQDRQERQERQERQQAQRQQRQSAGAPRVPMAEQEAEPMGALGQALAARFAQVQAEAEAEEDTTPTAPEVVAEAPEVETPDAPEAMPEAPEVETPEAPEAMPEFTEEAAPEAEAEEAPEAVAEEAPEAVAEEAPEAAEEEAPEAAEEEAPEASTYATDETAESVEAASDDTAEEATDVSGAEDAVDQAAANEAEEEGTGGASADAGTEEASDASLADVTDEAATDQPSQSGGEGAPSQADADADAGEETEA